MKKDTLANLLALWRLPDVGPVKFKELINNPEPHLKNADWKAVEQDLKWADASDHHIITQESKYYPERLKEIHSAPPVLFIQGDISLLKKAQIGMVGSRNPTPSGMDNAYQFSKHFASNGLIITSGLARGIDSACHEGALAGNGKTIAVMGTGPDIIYPKRHQALAHKIIENGCLVTEFPTGVAPFAQNFPRRNRIISGLCLGILVVEAAYASGSLVTARYALEQNREVFAIPGSIQNPMARGCHALIKQGAKLVETAEDVLEEINVGAGLVPALFQTITTDKTGHPQGAPLQGEKGQILKFLGFEPTPIDLIIARSGLTAEKVSSILLHLELEGCITSVPGGYSRVR